MTEFWDKIRGHILKDIYIDDDDLIIVTDRGMYKAEAEGD